jgi:ABC-2 type transport system ATP-binding protein
VHLQVKNLAKTYETVRALKGVSFTIESGTVVGLIGPNGAGKTTLLKCILSLLRYEQGEIFYNRQLLLNRQEIAEEISYIPDQPIYYEDLTLEENLHLYAMLSGLSRQEFLDKKHILIKHLELEEYLGQLPDRLSKGNKQKLMIAMAFMKRYGLMLADEPFSGLDPSVIRNLKDLFVRIKKENKSVLISTHLLDLAQTICDSYIFLDHGSILATGNHEDILRIAGFSAEDKFSLEKAYITLLKGE